MKRIQRKLKVVFVTFVVLAIAATMCGCIDENPIDTISREKGEEISQGEIKDADECTKKVDKIIEEASGEPEMEKTAEPVVIEVLSESDDGWWKCPVPQKNEIAGVYTEVSEGSPWKKYWCIIREDGIWFIGFGRTYNEYEGGKWDYDEGKLNFRLADPAKTLFASGCWDSNRLALVSCQSCKVVRDIRYVLHN